MSEGTDVWEPPNNRVRPATASTDRLVPAPEIGNTEKAEYQSSNGQPEPRLDAPKLARDAISLQVHRIEHPNQIKLKEGPGPNNSKAALIATKESESSPGEGQPAHGSFPDAPPSPANPSSQTQPKQQPKAQKLSEAPDPKYLKDAPQVATTGAESYKNSGASATTVASQFTHKEQGRGSKLDLRDVSKHRTAAEVEERDATGLYNPRRIVAATFPAAKAFMPMQPKAWVGGTQLSKVPNPLETKDAELRSGGERPEHRSLAAAQPTLALASRSQHKETAVKKSKNYDSSSEPRSAAKHNVRDVDTVSKRTHLNSPEDQSEAKRMRAVSKKSEISPRSLKHGKGHGGKKVNRRKANGSVDAERRFSSSTANGREAGMVQYRGNSQGQNGGREYRIQGPLSPTSRRVSAADLFSPPAANSLRHALGMVRLSEHSTPSTAPERKQAASKPSAATAGIQQHAQAWAEHNHAAAVAAEQHLRWRLNQIKNAQESEENLQQNDRMASSAYLEVARPQEGERMKKIVNDQLQSHNRWLQENAAVLGSGAAAASQLRSNPSVVQAQRNEQHARTLLPIYAAQTTAPGGQSIQQTQQQWPSVPRNEAQMRTSLERYAAESTPTVAQGGQHIQQTQPQWLSIPRNGQSQSRSDPYLVGPGDLVPEVRHVDTPFVTQVIDLSSPREEDEPIRQRLQSPPSRLSNKRKSIKLTTSSEQSKKRSAVDGDQRRFTAAPAHGRQQADSNIPNHLPPVDPKKMPENSESPMTYLVRQLLGQVPVSGNEPPMVLGPELVTEASNKIRLVINKLVQMAVDKAEKKHDDSKASTEDTDSEESLKKILALTELRKKNEETIAKQDRDITTLKHFAQDQVVKVQEQEAIIDQLRRQLDGNTLVFAEQQRELALLRELARPDKSILDHNEIVRNLVNQLDGGIAKVHRQAKEIDALRAKAMLDESSIREKTAAIANLREVLESKSAIVNHQKSELETRRKKVNTDSKEVRMKEKMVEKLRQENKALKEGLSKEKRQGEKNLRNYMRASVHALKVQRQHDANG